MTARASAVAGGWAIVLRSAQRTIPGVRAIDRRTFFVSSSIGIDSIQGPYLYRTRERAREARSKLRPRFAAEGLRATVVPVRVAVREMPTLCSAEIGQADE